jgi:hypothetical protein
LRQQLGDQLARQVVDHRHAFSRWFGLAPNEYRRSRMR